MLRLSFNQSKSELMVRAAATILFRALERQNIEQANISDLAEHPQYGFTASAVAAPVGPKLVRITDLRDGKIEWDSVPYCECARPDKYLLRENDILFARTGATTGKTHLVRSAEPAVFASYLIRLRPKPNVHPGYLYAFFQSDDYWDQVSKEKEGSAQPNVNGEKLASLKIPRVRPELQRAIAEFISCVRLRQDGDSVSLPRLPEPLTVQQRIFEKVEEILQKVDFVRKEKDLLSTDSRRLLLGLYYRITNHARELPMSNIAPLTRRPVSVDLSAEYPELGIRSFGKGTFHKPPVNGASVGTKKLYRIERGDLLFNIVFAWEGAVAVAQHDDDGRVGSHRFLTCVPRERVATSDFLCFHFLTDHGLLQLGESSPGGAGRNRTLGLKPLANIKVPVPPIERQLWFNDIRKKVAGLAQISYASTQETNAFIPSILDKAFRGEL